VRLNGDFCTAGNAEDRCPETVTKRLADRASRSAGLHP
jgi:hypothetical protein